MISLAMDKRTRMSGRDARYISGVMIRKEVMVRQTCIMDRHRMIPRAGCVMQSGSGMSAVIRQELRTLVRMVQTLM